MSERYAKLSANIIFSSMWDEDGDTCKIWMTMLALKDEKGDIKGINLTGIARVARQTMEKVAEAVQKFQSPDTRSSTPTDDGKRLLAIDGGWHVINHEKYQEYGWSPEKKQYERERKAKWRAGRKADYKQVDPSTIPPARKPHGVEFSDTPTLEMCLKWGAAQRKLGADYTDEEVTLAFHSLRAGGWAWGKGLTRDWRSSVVLRINSDRDRKVNHGNNKSGAGRARTDANQNTLNDGGGINPASLGRRHIKQVPDVSGSGADWNADGGEGFSGGAAPAQG